MTQGLALWLAGPGTSARKNLLSGALPAPGGWNRIGVETADLDATLAKAFAAGDREGGNAIKGPGGRQGACGRYLGKCGGGVRGAGRLNSDAGQPQDSLFVTSRTSKSGSLVNQRSLCRATRWKVLRNGADSRSR
jgi:hypothetical protein